MGSPFSLLPERGLHWPPSTQVPPYNHPVRLALRVLTEAVCLHALRTPPSPSVLSCCLVALGLGMGGDSSPWGQ